MTSFGDAFKAARKAGKTVFSFNGKKYHTKTKDEMAKVKAKVPVPSPRPDPQTTGSIPKPTPKPDMSIPKPTAKPAITSTTDRAAGVAAERQISTAINPSRPYLKTSKPDERFAKKKRTWGEVGMKIWRGEAADLFR